MSILAVAAEHLCFPASHATHFGNVDGFHVQAGYERFIFNSKYLGVDTDLIQQADTFTLQTSIWFSVRILSNASSNEHGVGLGKSGTNGALVVGCDNTNHAALWKRAQDGTWTKLASSTFLVDIGAKIDIHVTSFGASGNVKMYANGTTDVIIDYTGDLTWSGATAVDCIVWAWNYWADYSQIIAATTDTRRMSLVTLKPNGAGAANTFASGAYSDIDDDGWNGDGITAVDTDKIVSSAAGQACQFALSNLPAGEFTIRAVKVLARASCDESGPQTLKMGIRSGTTTNVDAGRALATGWEHYARPLMATNPVTGVAFTKAEVDALQIAFESAA